jgi:hypothetical protein
LQKLKGQEKMKTILSIIITILSVILFFVGIPYFMGYKIYYSTDVNYDFEAISAFGQWVSALIPIALVFLSVYITNKFDKTKSDIRSQNLATVEYVNEMVKNAKSSLESESKPNILTAEEERKILKDKAYRYICIAGFTKTEKVAKHLDVPKDQAFELLYELLKLDGKITAGGRATKENIDNVIWLKK